MSGLDDVVDVTASAQLGNRLVISGSRLIDDGVLDIKGMITYAAPALWWSDDSMTWHLAQLPGGYEDRQFSIGTIEDVTAGGPGFVALGASLPIWSVDGESWSASTGSGVPYPGQLSFIGASDDGLIAYGFNSAIGAPAAGERMAARWEVRSGSGRIIRTGGNGERVGLCRRQSKARVTNVMATAAPSGFHRHDTSSGFRGMASARVAVSSCAGDAATMDASSVGRQSRQTLAGALILVECGLH